jgi:large subunit ribosomal protein L10
MAISRSKKEDILTMLRDEVQTQVSVGFLTTHNTEQSLNSEITSEIRKKARSKGASVQVIKNTLLSRAFTTLPSLIGPTYVVYLTKGETGDEVKIPKIVSSIVEDYKDSISILGSLVHGEYFDTVQTKTLSNTPSKQESMASVAGLLQSFASSIAITVKEIPSGVVRGVSEMSKKI